MGILFKPGHDIILISGTTVIPVYDQNHWKHCNDFFVLVYYASKYMEITLAVSLQCPYLPLVQHIFVAKLGHHWFREWLVACLTPSHYLKQS